MSLRDVTIAWDYETGDKVRVRKRAEDLGDFEERELKLDAERGGETNLRAMGAKRDRNQMKNPT